MVNPYGLLKMIRQMLVLQRVGIIQYMIMIHNQLMNIEWAQMVINFRMVALVIVVGEIKFFRERNLLQFLEIRGPEEAKQIPNSGVHTKLLDV